MTYHSRRLRMNMEELKKQIQDAFDKERYEERLIIKELKGK